MRYKVICPKIVNVKIDRMKYFRYEIFAIYGILEKGHPALFVSG